MEAKIETLEKKLSWKKRIKYVQIAILISLVVLYFLWGFFNEQTHYFETQKAILQQKELTLANLKAEKNEIDLISQRIGKILKKKEDFIKAYNVCYPKYAKRLYLLSGSAEVISLKDCMYDKWFKQTFIKELSNEDIEKMAIALWILKNTNNKLTYPQTDVLYSLDKNIFYDKMEDSVQMLSFGLPKLVNKKLDLYSVDFTLKLQVNYSLFKNVLNAFQNKIYLNKPVYYSIRSISSFDVTRTNDLQPLLIQGEFYFTK